MSILAATTQPSLPQPPVMITVGFAISIAILIIAYVTRLLRPGSLTLPDRLPLDRSGVMLLVVTVIGAGMWIGGQVGYLILSSIIKAGPKGDVGPAQEFDPANFTPTDFAFLSTLPALLGFVTLAIGDAILGGPAVRRGLGYGRWKIWPGVPLGVLAMVLTLPLMYSFSVGLEGIYQLVGYEHPKAHELLGALGKSTEPLIRWLIVAGAVIGAPVFEELLFRAHLQTTLRRLAFWIGGLQPVADSGGFPVPFRADVPPNGVIPPGEFVAPPVPPSPPPATLPIPSSADMPLPPPPLFAPPLMLPASALPPPPTFDYAMPPTPLPPPEARVPAWPSWVAIVITSILFALVHPLWTAPLIFALSLCLGYAYERTNNLWVSITMHALFNGVSTALFLTGLTDG